MIKKHSDDPDVTAAAERAYVIIKETLESLSKPYSFDYGGHILEIGEYKVCIDCTQPIAEAQAATSALKKRSEIENDETVKEHIDVAAQLFRVEAEAATLRAELHNGFGTEKILNVLLGYLYDHNIHDDYHHSHKKGK